MFLWFEAISKLKVNKDKSEAIPIGMVDSLENIVSVLGVELGDSLLLIWVFCWELFSNHQGCGT